MRRRRLLAALLLAGLGLAAAGCSDNDVQLDRGTLGAGNPSQVPAHGPEIAARPLPPYGTVLTTSRGFALYVFEPDHAQRVTCSGDCLKTWPALHPTGPLAKIAGAGLDRALLGEDRDSSGRPVVTYRGWPLYLYAPDPAPGYATGQALNSDGGLWYLISADGQVVRS